MTQILRRHLSSLYVATMVVAGGGLLVMLLADSGNYFSSYPPLALLVLMVAVVLGEVVPVKIGPDQGEVAPSTTFAFALLMTGGVAIAALAQVLASIIADIYDRKAPSRTAFNAAQYAVALWLSSLVLEAVPHLSFPARFGIADILALGAAGGAFFLFNAVAVTAAVALDTGTPLRRVFSSDLTFHAGTEAILLGLAPLAVLAVDYSPELLPLLVLPLFAINRAGRHAVLNERLALHDTLTDLPNRALFLDRAGVAIAASARQRTGVSVMLIDLDHFKEINDTLGHHVGDEVLCRVAERMRATLRDADTVARLGGDEFAVLLDRASDSAEIVAEKLRAAVAQQMDVRGIPLLVHASVGIATSPEDGTDIETLMQRADVAMYQAKGSDGGVKSYAIDRDDHSVARLRMAAALRSAIDNGLIDVHFQPQLSGRDGALSGVEALARWHHEGAWVPPDSFIPIAEQTGLIVPLTLTILDASARELARWRAAGLDVSVAVNLSARTLVQETFPDDVVAVCERWSVPPAALVLEITESMVASDPRTTIPIINRLAALGATISIDDFGTGFASLEYLKLLPVGELKIDQSFITGMVRDSRDHAIVASTIELGHRLGLRIVAEGVETLTVQAQLSFLGCDTLQGFLFNKALTSDEVLHVYGGAIAAADTVAARRSA